MGEARLYFVYSRSVFCPKFHIQVPFLSMGLSKSPSRKRAPLPREIIPRVAATVAAAAADTSPHQLGSISMGTSGTRRCVHVHSRSVEEGGGERREGGRGMCSCTHAPEQRQEVSSSDSHFSLPCSQTDVCGCRDSGAQATGRRGVRGGGGGGRKRNGAPKMFHHNDCCVGVGC